MPRFRYSLQPALDRAISAEREALGVAARAEAALEAEARVLAALEGDLLGLRRSGYGLGAAQALVAPWPDVAAHAVALEKLRAVRRSSRDAARHAFACARVAHDVVRRAKQALSRHRERRYETYLLACERREANELAESSALSRQAAARRIGNYRL